MSAAEIEETRKALREGIDLCRQDGHECPSPRLLVWRLMQDAAETLARLPDKERVWLLSADRVIWPELARPSEDNRAIERQIQNEIEILGIRDQTPTSANAQLSVTDPSAPRRMLTVLSWLRCVTARTPIRVKRDKLVTLALAQGQSYRHVRRLMLGEKSDAAIRMVKEKVLGQVILRLRSTGFDLELLT